MHLTTDQIFGNGDPENISHTACMADGPVRIANIPAWLMVPYR